MYKTDETLIACKEAEENIIAEIITDTDNLKYIDELNVEDFYYKTNQKIFELIKELKNKEQNISDIATVMKLLPPLSRNTCPIKQRRQRNRSLKAYPKCKITIFRTLFDSVIYILPQRYSQVRRQTACLIKHKFISSKPLSSYLIYRIYSSRAGPGGQSVVNLIRHACIL